MCKKKTPVLNWNRIIGLEFVVTDFCLCSHYFFACVHIMCCCFWSVYVYSFSAAQPPFASLGTQVLTWRQVLTTVRTWCLISEFPFCRLSETYLSGCRLVFLALTEWVVTCRRVVFHQWVIPALHQQVVMILQLVDHQNTETTQHALKVFLQPQTEANCLFHLPVHKIYYWSHDLACYKGT